MKKYNSFTAIFISIFIISLFSAFNIYGQRRAHSKQLLTLKSPNGNEQIKIGADFLIKWNVNNFNGNINIFLLNKRRSVGTIARNVNVMKKNHLWKVGKTIRNKLRTGGGYFILLESNNKKIFDKSNRPFSINSQTTLPNKSFNINQKVNTFQQRTKAPQKQTNTFKMMQQQNNLPDFIIDRCETSPQSAILGQPYKLKVWFKQYPDLSIAPKLSNKIINIFAPALLVKLINGGYLPKVWNPNSPQLTFDIPADNIIDITKQQKKKLIITIDTNNQVKEKNEFNNTQECQYGLYPENTAFADLLFYDHYIKKLQIESQYYFKSDSSGYQKGVNEVVHCTGYVVNFGNADARPFKIKIVGDLDRDLKTKFTRYIQINKIIKPNEIYTFHFNMQWPSPGMKTAQFWVDINNTVKESNENNNHAPTVLTVKIHD